MGYCIHFFIYWFIHYFIGQLFTEGLPFVRGFPGGGSTVKNLPANAGDTDSIPWIGIIPWRRKWKLTPVILPGKSHGQRSLVGYSLKGQSQTKLNDQALALQFDKEMLVIIPVVMINN